MKLKAFLLAGVLAFGALPALAADPQTGVAVTVGSGTTLCGFVNGGQTYTCSIPMIQNASGVGAPVSPTNPMPVSSTPGIPSGATAIQGSGSTTGSGALTLLADPGAGVVNTILAVQCWNSSSTTITATFNDAASTQIIVPQTFGNNITFPPGSPLTVAAHTAFTVTPSAGVTTFGCATQGYKK